MFGEEGGLKNQKTICLYAMILIFGVFVFISGITLIRRLYSYWSNFSSLVTKLCELSFKTNDRYYDVNTIIPEDFFEPYEINLEDNLNNIENNNENNNEDKEPRYKPRNKGRK